MQHYALCKSHIVVSLLELTSHENNSHAGVSEQLFPAERPTDVKEVVFGDSLYVFSLSCTTNERLANYFL
jgi:hypothetical protein